MKLNYDTKSSNVADSGWGEIWPDFKATIRSFFPDPASVPNPLQHGAEQFAMRQLGNRLNSNRTFDLLPSYKTELDKILKKFGGGELPWEDNKAKFWKELDELNNQRTNLRKQARR